MIIPVRCFSCGKPIGHLWEEYKKRGYEGKISKLSANLITIAILSNTLNFGASVTDKRDTTAFEELKKYTDMTEKWDEQYFEEVEKDIFKNVEQAIKSDTKTLNLPTVDFPVVMGQMELWNASKFLNQHTKETKTALEKFGYPDWFLSLPSISEKKNYIYTESEKVKKKNIISKKIIQLQ